MKSIPVAAIALLLILLAGCSSTAKRFRLAARGTNVPKVGIVFQLLQ